jgi:hypothetical protein
MVYQYVVILKRNSNRYIDRFSVLLCLLSILAFVFEQIQAGKFNILFSFISLVLATGIVINTYTSLKKKKPVRYRFLLMLSGVCWIAMPWLQWLSISFFLLSFLEYQAKYPLEIGFTPEQVVINSLFKKKYAWSEFNNVILKDGLLTLDFKNNRIFQKETVEDDEPDAEEDEFNTFCKTQLGRESREVGKSGSPEVG